MWISAEKMRVTCTKIFLMLQENEAVEQTGLLLRFLDNAEMQSCAPACSLLFRSDRRACPESFIIASAAQASMGIDG